MDTYQLKKVLSRDLGSSFGGVYPRDLIPDHLNFKEKAIVINTDPHDQPGTHWVCLYLDGDTVEYFDSYGFPPLYSEIQEFIDRNSNHMKYNENHYQELDSNVCGQYCVYFLHHRHRRGPKVLKQLFPTHWTQKQTDRYVRQWFKEKYRKPKAHKGQCCKSFNQHWSEKMTS